MTTLLDIVSTGLWLPIKCLNAALLDRTAKNAKDNCRGGRHTALLPSIKDACINAVKGCSSLTGLLLCGIWGKLRSNKIIFQPAGYLEVSDYPAWFPKWESYFESNDHHRKWFWVFNTHELFHNCLQNLKYEVAGKMKRLSWSNPKENVVNLQDISNHK